MRIKPPRTLKPHELIAYVIVICMVIIITMCQSDPVEPPTAVAPPDTVVNEETYFLNYLNDAEWRRHLIVIHNLDTVVSDTVSTIYGVAFPIKEGDFFKAKVRDPKPYLDTTAAFTKTTLLITQGNDTISLSNSYFQSRYYEQELKDFKP